MARMIHNKFGCVSPTENRCLGQLEHDLKTDKHWKERIRRGKESIPTPVRQGNMESTGNRERR